MYLVVTKTIYLKSIFGMILGALLTVGIFLLGCTLYTKNSQLDDVIIIVRGGVAIAIFSIPMLLVTIFPSHIVFTGKELPHKYGVRLVKPMILSTVLGFILMIFISVYHTSRLEKLGYIRCSGTPLGYMPAMGVKYVKEPQLCKKKTH
ncbi:DUF1240 domain-containing protein [uncultured Shewanella sp.]|uniref:DUF1240 domain-containing protein n=1 Tax=uncultured Shewanella sp. TaxID=173975 RepID=UPI00260F9046|nr:DUF1240 domain-containing protein [uncultured Shewanella sp.]